MTLDLLEGLMKIRTYLYLILALTFIPAAAQAHTSRQGSFEVGVGGNAFISNTDMLSDTAGGVVKLRYFILDAVAIELSGDINSTPIDRVDNKSYVTAGFISSNADGDLTSVPFLPTVLIYLPEIGNFHPYIFGGVGYQFNKEDDFNVAVTTSSGSVVTFEGKVEDSHIGVFGAGADIFLNDNTLLNFDVRYQSAEFDVDTTGTVGGSSITITEDGENFDSVIFRFSLLFIF